MSILARIGENTMQEVVMLKHTSSQPLWDPDLVAKYNVNGPRYTSYPTANHFNDSISPQTISSTLAHLDPARDLSLYIHVPFCDTICYYCACNKIVTNNRKHAVRYLEYLFQEMQRVSETLTSRHRVRQIHFGGGTPTYLTDDQLTETFARIRACFDVAPPDELECSIELDPRTVSRARIDHLVQIGVNRVSLGVQDFDPQVQQAINRIQSVADTASIMAVARDHGIESISMDLIYGLPLQSTESFARTLDQVIELSPDRISLYSYAHLPDRFKTQKQINVVELPTATTKLDLLHLAIERFRNAGYEYVGMDHFAKQDDGLIGALNDGTMHRNFQGYTTHGDCELIGLGVSAISQVDDVYSQNAKTLEEYYQALDDDRLPVERGIQLTAEDRIRRDVIVNLMCRFEVDAAGFESEHGLSFAQHFAPELASLESFINDGLASWDGSALKVTPAGRFFIRNVCMVFDSYLSPTAGGFSKAI
jgi:oxygen-independent coproporphyrinogen-3 oxidase